MFGWVFEVNALSRFWNWNLIKICVRVCDMISTLGSVVPLAMFERGKEHDPLCKYGSKLNVKSASHSKAPGLKLFIKSRCKTLWRNAVWESSLHCWLRFCPICAKKLGSSATLGQDFISHVLNIFCLFIFLWKMDWCVKNRAKGWLHK